MRNLCVKASERLVKIGRKVYLVFHQADLHPSLRRKLYHILPLPFTFTSNLHLADARGMARGDQVDAADEQGNREHRRKPQPAENQRQTQHE